MPHTSLPLVRIAAAAAAVASLAGCVAYPVHPRPAVAVMAPPRVAVVEPVAPPPGVVYVAPVEVAPGPGYLWRYHRVHGWGWWHPHYGWRMGWR
ncbi:hypothetical protein ACFW16_12720 [Inquilinus sp. NPDC058860]|uniref:hypothetical protein n=1 Tax=Inquilinus sp. NPDC058860 TaxID=3346652 RepID=UPI003679937F